MVDREDSIGRNSAVGHLLSGTFFLFHNDNMGGSSASIAGSVGSLGIVHARILLSIIICAVRTDALPSNVKGHSFMPWDSVISQFSIKQYHQRLEGLIQHLVSPIDRILHIFNFEEQKSS